MFVDPIIPGSNAVVQESQQQQIATSPAAAASGPEPDGHNESATHSEQIPANQSTAEGEAKTGSAEAMPVDEIGTPNPASQHECAQIQIEIQTPKTATTPPTVSTPTSSTTESVVTKMTLTVRSICNKFFWFQTTVLHIESEKIS